MSRNQEPPPDERQEQSLPQHADAERYLLAAVLQDPSNYQQLAEQVGTDDFTIEPNRRIWKSMGRVAGRGEALVLVTVCEDLKRYRELDKIGGMSYLVSLEDGTPRISKPEVYAKIVKEKAALRRLIYQARAVALAAMQQEQTAEEIIAGFQSGLAKIFDSARDDGNVVQTPEEVVASIGFEDFMAPWKKNPPISTGYDKLDDILYGFIPGNMYVLGGDTSDGKSTGILSFIENLAKAGTPSVLFSCEMNKQALMHRLMCGKAGVSQRRFICGEIENDERKRLHDALGYFVELPFLIDDTPALSIYEFETRLRRLVREKGIKFAGLDYLQFMNMEEAGDGKHRFRDDNHALSFITKRIAQLARELNIAILVLSQFNKEINLRKGKDRRPRLNDLYGSGSIKKDAYAVILLYREERHQPDRVEVKGVVEFILAKHRNGPTGTVEMQFSRGYTRFEQADTQTHMNYMGDKD